jgi:hypothetical protein
MLRKRLKPASLPQHGRLADVRFGSKADISRRNRHVRFTPESGHSSVCAKGEKTRQNSCGALTVSHSTFE